MSILIRSYLQVTVTSSIYIPHLQLIIHKSYANHISLLYKPMLLVTPVSILTGPNTLTVQLEYTNLFQSQSQWQYKAILMFGRSSLFWPHNTLYLSLTNY